LLLESVTTQKRELEEENSSWEKMENGFGNLRSLSQKFCCINFPNNNHLLACSLAPTSQLVLRGWKTSRDNNLIIFYFPCSLLQTTSWKKRNNLNLIADLKLKVFSSGWSAVIVSWLCRKNSPQIIIIKMIKNLSLGRSSFHGSRLKMSLFVTNSFFKRFSFSQIYWPRRFRALLLFLFVLIDYFQFAVFILSNLCYNKET